LSSTTCTPLSASGDFMHITGTCSGSNGMTDIYTSP
jgi:hypothetical protein